MYVYSVVYASVANVYLLLVCLYVAVHVYTRTHVHACIPYVYIYARAYICTSVDIYTCTYIIYIFVLAVKCFCCTCIHTGSSGTTSKKPTTKTRFVILH